MCMKKRTAEKGFLKGADLLFCDVALAFRQDSARLFRTQVDCRDATHLLVPVWKVTVVDVANLHEANERCCYKVTQSLISWAQT